MSTFFDPDFSGFSRLHDELGQPSLAGTAIEHIMNNSPLVWGLDKQDGRVGRLLDRGHDLRDPGLSFFQSSQTWHKWDKAISETGVLSVWADAGLLQITEDTSKAGCNAPFDAVLRIGGIRIAADIKTANSAASGMIIERFEPFVSEWACGKNRSVPELEVSITGSLDLRRLGPRWREIDEQFVARLNGLQDIGEVTIELNCPLPNDPHDPTDAGDLRLRVRLLEQGDSPNHQWNRPSTYQDLAGAWRDASTEFAESLILSHAEKKARHTEAGKPIPFILAYYQSKFGDLRVNHVQGAMTRLQGPPNFYGVQFVDDCGTTSVKTFHAHRNAQFDPSLSPKVLLARLEQ